MKHAHILPVVLLTLILVSCAKKKEQTLFELMDNTGINFRNDVADGKKENSFLFRNFYNGGGVALGDINNDGLADVFLTSNMGENKMYLNKGDFHFEDITQKGGFRQDSMWSTGVVFVDINNDGWLDIYVCNSGHMSTGHRLNKLYINNHDLTFTESAAAYGLNHKGYSTQVSFFDYDLDGDLDCFMIDNSPIPVNQLGYNNNRDLPDNKWNVAEFLKGGGNHLYRNDNNHFTDVTSVSGIHSSLISFGLGVSVGDINSDGYPDIYVSNDSYERDYLYVNQRNGSFKDEFEERFDHTSFSSMGSDLADINNDGLPDIFNTDMLPDDDYRLKTTGAFDNIDLFNTKLKTGFYYQYVKNCLQINNKKGKFIESGNYSGVSASDWSWGALLFDMDNDGYNDIYVCNGVNRDVTDLDFIEFFANDVIQKMVLTGQKQDVDEVLKHIPQNPLVNKAYHNQKDLRFKDMAMSWGFEKPTFSNGAAYGDLDNDGDLDLVVNNENQPSFVYRNNSRQINKHHYISVQLQGKEKNTFAIGTKIDLYRGNEIITREQVPSRGFQSSMDYKLVIGLGTNAQIDSMIITWPDLTVSRLDKPAVDTLHLLKQTAMQSQPRAPQKPVIKAILDSVSTVFEQHIEDDNIDFYYERNLPKMISREGPKAAIADVNGDGLEDLYIGGTAGHWGKLYIQNKNGGFVKSVQPAFEQFKDFEDVAVHFFDADKDNDMDLLVCPGGNNNKPDSRQMQLRLYKNDGKGNFSIDVSAFPNTGMNIGVAISEDFNQDGFPDLFIGGRSNPRNYGVDPSSYLFINDGKGHFTDIAPAKNPDIANIGMVTGAVWADLTGDARKELIITGEWMATRIFRFNKDHFEEIKTNLQELLGWWQTVSVADLNGDGKNDLVIGNIGENFYLHPDQEHPVKLWLNDFDQNQARDRVLTSVINGKDMPVFMKHEMEDQVPSLKKKNLKHRDYANKPIQELFSAEIIKTCKIKEFNYCASIIAINEGEGKFRIQKMPAMLQLSSVNAVQITDLDNNGRPDLLLGGNEYGLLPQFERLDAGRGAVMMNLGAGNFRLLDAQESGVEVNGQVRDIKEIKTAAGKQLLFLRNNMSPVLFKPAVSINAATVLPKTKK
ncbi:MAG TPA: VCBS repeat-containing protein [Sediminibacterium sp.]